MYISQDENAKIWKGILIFSKYSELSKKNENKISEDIKADIE